jgi:hypothetical protein
MRKCWAMFLFLAGLMTIAGGAWAAGPRWPTVEQQLARDRVVPGSALEHLIRANQNVRLLRPEEARDKLGLPLWVRVLWRKSHPEGRYSADDPSGGYPRVLREVYHWMLAHQDLRPGLPEADSPPPNQKTLVGTNLRISGLLSNPRSESDIRINYWDDTKVIAASNNLGGSGRQAQFYSSDGGATWGRTLLPLRSPDDFHSDPTVDWTSDGTAWATAMGLEIVQPPPNLLIDARMRAYKSTNNGQTWTFDDTFSGTQTGTDKQMMWVDHSAASPWADYIHTIWHDGPTVYMNRRTGPSGSWGASPLQVSGAETTGTGIGADVKTNAEGDVFGFWPDTGSQGIYVVQSTDGGSSYGAPAQIATTYDTYEIILPSFSGRRALIYVTAGTFQDDDRDNVYAAWTDLSGETDCDDPSEEPGTDASSDCKSRIWFSRSTDGGATWSAPAMINHQSSRNDQFNPWMAVDEENGAIAIVYYDTVDDANRLKTDLWYQVSFDDGQTWTPAVKVTTAQTDETASSADADNQYGDYNGLSGLARKFLPSWTDRRNNAREEIWTAKIDEPRTDVWGKDKPWDTGGEPDPLTAADNMWESEDIWVRNDQTPGQHQNPFFGRTNYVHVMVRNRSATVTARKVPVKVYYAFASAGLSWPIDWTYIGTAYVESLAPGATTEVVVPWIPPGMGHYCLLSRLVTAQDPMTHEETTDQNYNTRYNNNIIWKNVEVVKFRFACIREAWLHFRNLETVARPIDLVFREQPQAPGFLTQGQVVVDLGTALATRWQQAGAQGQGVQLMDDRHLRITHPTNAFIRVPFQPREAFQVGMRFEVTTGCPFVSTVPGMSYLFEAVQRGPGGEIEGGVTYDMETNSDDVP